MALYERTINHFIYDHTGEKAPSMDIDVYLQPLIKELLQLWNGVDAFDT